ncbi:DUF4861 family protein [Maribacter sp. 2308TA10-17]|uniref:DUF4861 family protein n=1 Tax=Maribacter sp. 2308TA10-17 TaxID=3386276 RepID=UPI0039BCCAC8
MKRTLLFVFRIVLISVHVGCTAPEKENIITVKNPLKISRSFETVTIDIKSLSFQVKNEDGFPKHFRIEDVTSSLELISQAVDTNDDNQADLLLFQPKLKPGEEKKYRITAKYTKAKVDTVPNCYSRFIPERTDDYAWENNRVAFRTYGPTAQKMKEDNVPGGTLSSGIDAWLKRVEYPIINNWYKKELETDGTYHEDTGEGLDNFHVGVSRGIGGISVKTDSTYHFSKNFSKWERLYNGPIRTAFVLTYANWDANGRTIIEEKHISLDYGSNLSKFEVHISGTDTISVGLTLHENDGEATTALDRGFISYWQPHKESELGTAIVAKDGEMVAYEKYLSDKIDESNAYAHFNVDEGKVTYYAGFGWKKSGQYDSKQEWETYLHHFSNKLNHPLEVFVP